MKLPAAVTAFVLCAFAVQATPREQSTDQLLPKLRKEQQEAERQKSNPVGKTKALIRASEILVTLAHRAAAEGESEAMRGRIADYLDTVVNARRTMFESGRDPHKKTDGFQDLEIALRRHLRALEDIRKALPFDDQATIKDAIAQATTIRDEILNAVLGTKNEPQKKR